MLHLVDKFVEELCKNYNDRNYNYIYNHMLDKDFRSTGSYNDFQKFMDRKFKKLGKAGQKQRWWIGWNIYLKPEGTFLQVRYTITYENSTAVETFILKKTDKSLLLASWALDPRHDDIFEEQEKESTPDDYNRMREAIYGRMDTAGSETNQ